jgi:phosphate transport system permease protein
LGTGTQGMGTQLIDFEVRRPRQDTLFRAVARVAGGITLVLMVVIFIVLLVRSYRVLHVYGISKFLTTQHWVPEGGVFGVGSLLFNTLMIGVVALVIAVPVSLCAALFISEYSPPPVASALKALIELLAAIPSVVFGYWGLAYLTPRIIPLSRWLADHLAFLPFFKVSSSTFAGSTFIAGVVVALMVSPVLTAVAQEVFSQAPTGQREAALALGGTRWGMIRKVVIPFGRGGIVGGTMLAFGRAVGETVAVVVLISATQNRQLHILESGANSISALIAETWGESNPIGLSALMAAGLTLFLLTLIVNAAASVIVNRTAKAGGLAQ